MKTVTSPRSYAVGSVTSADGTTVGYRQLGHGPGLILVHGGMMASQNFMKLATALSDTFTVYIPDRRGRGLTGPFGDDYGIHKDVEDIHALLNSTATHHVFGLSSGAIISLQSALLLPEIHKVALYEPPLSFGGSSPTAWVSRYDREIAQGKVASAMVSVIKGTQDSALVGLVPRFLLVPLMSLALKGDAKSVEDGDVALKDLVPTMHYDVYLVTATEGALESFRGLQSDVLLLGGSKSAGYLHTALDRLSAMLPHAQRVELPGVGHLAADNDGRPELVAAELRRFFA
jgi:pimeloyl-ACP methyl ester carboxylesterase